jgi:predicted outer membrane repeat protein
MCTRHLLVGLFATLALLGSLVQPLVFVASVQANPNALRVTPDGTGDGSDWASAANLQDALTAARNDATIDEIWVAAGVYYPDETSTTDSDSPVSFELVDGVAIYGGFTVGDESLDDRNPDPATNGTILSGDITQDDDILSGDNNGNTIPDGLENNSRGVVLSNSNADNAILDGFTITAGLSVNDGGGIQSVASDATFRNLIITNNLAGDQGGGVYIQDGSPSFTNIVISGNRSLNDGGGVLIFDARAAVEFQTFTNVVISGNQATDSGGGIFSSGDGPFLINVTITGNTAGGSGVDGGGGIALFNGTSDPGLKLQNTIVWGNTADAGEDQIEDFGTQPPIYEYSLVEGATAATLNGSDPDSGNNLDTDNPEFIDARSASEAPTAEGDYRLQADSPVIDQGDNSLNNEAFDLAGNPRQIDGDTDGTITIDLGAYEFQTFIPDDPDTGVAFSTTTINASEDGDTDSYDVVLQQQLTADVTVTIITDAQTSIVQPAQPVLTFTPSDWDVPQTVTVRAVDDSDREGPHTGMVLHTVASSELGAATLPIADVTVDITDNDAPGLVVNALSVSVTEGSTMDAYTVALNSPPTADVSVDIDAGTQLATDAQTLTFTPDNWDIPQTIMVTAVDDGDDEGNHSGAIAHSTTSSDSGYSGLTADVDVDIADNDADDPTDDPGNPSNPGSPTDQATVFLPFVAQ